mmetsp:Transcript_17738/g.38326  ORF Transcript_17738/g.38326 Transcript_17738/m.38326 type:complete len:247 (+) Transcript_17738:71-811(+)
MRVHKSLQLISTWCTLAALVDASKATMKDYLQAYEKNLSGFWNSVDKAYAHVSYNAGHLRGEARLIKNWEAHWLNHSQEQYGNLFENATVMEYGIGGGLLGKHLLEKYNARHYIGVDIAERQLKAAAERLGACCRHKYSMVQVNGSLNQADLKPFRIDVFVSQAVMQHFPSASYTRNFLGVLSQSRIPYLMLQVREGDARKQGTSVTFAQLVSREMLEKHLPNYQMIWQSPRGRKGYVFYWWHLRH